MAPLSPHVTGNGSMMEWLENVSIGLLSSFVVLGSNKM